MRPYNSRELETHLDSGREADYFVGCNHADRWIRKDSGKDWPAELLSARTGESGASLAAQLASRSEWAICAEPPGMGSSEQRESS